MKDQFDKEYNVKFLYCCSGGIGTGWRDSRQVEYVFDINEHVAELLRKRSSCPRDRLDVRFPIDNKYSYSLPSTTDNDMVVAVIRKIEEIANDRNSDGFYNHLVTNNGKHLAPAEIHRIMCEEYGLYDLSDEDNIDCEEANLEWWVAHFFIGFACLIIDDD